MVSTLHLFIRESPLGGFHRSSQYCAKVMQMIIDKYSDISAIFNEILP